MVDKSSAKVADYLGDDGDWDIQRLQRVLPPEALAKVLPLLPPIEFREDDSLAWLCEVDDSFTIASAYHLLA
ncbi:hypothetical protein SESBI_09465 [Sesbania bispinosa]|nr:hypothetical protein SESBI_09465 [Sesbania bispinosa]